MPRKEVTQTIIAHGHENIQATHPTTLEITKENQLSKKGDCILAVSADKSLQDLSAGFKKLLRRDSAKLSVSIEAGGAIERIRGFGSSRLILTHSSDMVLRKSNYVCSRTLAICGDKAAGDLPREFIGKLKNSKQIVKITLAVTA